MYSVNIESILVPWEYMFLEIAEVVFKPPMLRYAGYEVLKITPTS